MTEIIIAGVMFLVAAGTFVLSVRSFLEKGFLFHNAYLYASKQEREKMNKTPYYRQSAVVFFLIGMIFTVNGLALLLDWEWNLYAVLAIAVVAIVYAIFSTVAIEKKKKR